MRIILIRHGKTRGNVEQRYIGVTDEPLCAEGIAELKSIAYPHADRVISSPLKRCLQSADIIYPGLCAEVFDGLREYDFGRFENKRFEDIEADAEYIKWLESGGRDEFPGGESETGFRLRCCGCFEDIIRHNTALSIAFVVHGGIIMALLEKYAGIPFYSRPIKNGEFVCMETDGEGSLVLLS